jgi:hypothetical protein
MKLTTEAVAERRAFWEKTHRKHARRAKPKKASTKAKKASMKIKNGADDEEEDEETVEDEHADELLGKGNKTLCL